jgi:pilus assembly protein Flp/PilA
MKNWTAPVTQFLNDESGATAIEYGLIAGLISVVIAVALTTIGADLKTIFTTIGTKLTAASTAV